jgi:hypothetical protein
MLRQLLHEPQKDMLSCNIRIVFINLQLFWLIGKRKGDGADQRPVLKRGKIRRQRTTCPEASSS